MAGRLEVNTVPKIPSKTAPSHLVSLLRCSLEEGMPMDLSNCYYGPSTGHCLSSINEPMAYYYLLAGFAKVIGASNVLEVGTHFAGGSLAFIKGMDAAAVDAPRVVTVD